MLAFVFSGLLGMKDDSPTDVIVLAMAFCIASLTASLSMSAPYVKETV